jgi:hypothetical protein
MRNGALGSITGRDAYIIAEALATALVALEQLPPARQPTRNIADMKMVLNSLYPPSDVSIHLTTARWRFMPNLRPLGAQDNKIFSLSQKIAGMSWNIFGSLPPTIAGPMPACMQPHLIYRIGNTDFTSVFSSAACTVHSITQSPAPDRPPLA